MHDLSEIFEELAGRNYTIEQLLALGRNAGSRRIAIRYQYIAALLALDEKQTIYIRPSATNALILREIKNNAPHLTEPFSHMAETFHQAWFGHKPVSDEEFVRYNAAVEELIESEEA